MSIKGTLKANELAIAEITVNWLVQPATVKTRTAFVDGKSGITHAWISGTNAAWSKETLQVLESLRACIELDLAKIHMTSHEEDITERASGLHLPEEGGLAEHLGTADDTPSV